MISLRPRLSYANVCSTLALVIALSAGSAYAANTVFSTDIVDGEVKAPDLAANAVSSVKVKPDSLRLADLRGADVNGGSINLSGIANGRCSQVTLAVGGARKGEGVIVSSKGALQNGILLYGARVPADGSVTMDACNFSGTAMTAISDLPVRVITFG